jgi:hypothetical protein
MFTACGAHGVAYVQTSLLTSSSPNSLFCAAATLAYVSSHRLLLRLAQEITRQDDRNNISDKVSHS